MMTKQFCRFGRERNSRVDVILERQDDRKRGRLEGALCNGLNDLLLKQNQTKQKNITKTKTEHNMYSNN